MPAKSEFLRLWIFGPFSLTEFIVTRSKGKEFCDWMLSRSCLGRAIVTGELSMPSLLEVISNSVCVCGLSSWYTPMRLGEGLRAKA